MSMLNHFGKQVVLSVRKAVVRFRRLDREAIAAHYVKGDGLEIGALHNPLIVPRKARVRYVDRMSVAELRRQYPELASLNLTEPDIIDDGERLSTVGEGTQDFVVANHFLEHSENPIETVGNLVRVLRNGGILFMCIPDKRYTFDVDRPVTTYDHLKRDFREGPAWSRRQHFEEWVAHVEKVASPDQASRRVNELMNMGYSIHFHVWTQSELLQLVLKLRDTFRLGIELELFLKIEGEVLIILRKVT